MTDKELLELAAKAAGFTSIDFLSCDHWANVYDSEGRHSAWNPLTDDGDALRLAVRCGIEVCPDLMVSCIVTAFMVGDFGMNCCEEFGPLRDGSQDDPMTATRRVIVRSAADIGKAMP